MSSDKKLNVLDITDYNLIAKRNPEGSYSRETRENLYGIIEILRQNSEKLSSLEKRLLDKFQSARFRPLEVKNRRVLLEVFRYRLSKHIKSSIKLTTAAVIAIGILGMGVYHFLLADTAKQKVDQVYFATLNKMGLASKDNLDKTKEDLTSMAALLQKSRQKYLNLNKTIESMILNNKVTENLKYIIRQVYNHPETKYVKKGDNTVLTYNGKEIASYKAQPELWYILGIVETGVFRVYYDNQEIVEIETIFGRQGEETPTGEYKIINKVYKPTWYKKGDVEGQIKVRAIPHGHPDHEIGSWWVGLEKLGEPTPGSYGIHGVNSNKLNEFYKKNFDWRNGSAGCPNLQDWNLDFLARMVPIGVRMDIVKKDKWIKSRDFVPPKTT